MLDEMFSGNGKHKDEIEKYEEDVAKPFLHKHVRGFTNSIEENLAEAQFEYIREKAASGESFVIVGRCGEAVLRGNENLVSVFVLGDMYDKIQRVMKKYALSEKDAIDKINRHDRKRKKYHNTYSDFKWGDSRGYDLCVNSSKLGVEGTAEMLCHYIEDVKERK
jgi:cytidylate kinase